MRCPEVGVSAVGDILTTDAKLKKLDGLINKPYKFFEPVKGADSERFPKIDCVKTSVQRQNANYFGKYIEKCIRDISKKVTYMQDKVILVDENDNEIGVEENMKAHELGKLHRAFSIFIFNTEGNLLLQRRALSKYHSAGLWTNTCCSHPKPGETTESAAHRRIVEEMGFDCDFDEVFSFIYKAPFDNGFVEHEFDHVFIGECEVDPSPNPEEVHEWKWVDMNWIKDDMKKNPQEYTEWFKMCFDNVLDQIKSKN